MQKESLEITINAIIEKLEQLDLDIYDKMELMINLRNFLDFRMYEENIKTLNQNIKRKVRVSEYGKK